MNDLPAFPVDDVTLDLLEKAVATTADDPEPGRITLFRLLEFLSGHDRSMDVEIEPGVIDATAGGPIYSPHDVIAALIVEIRRLRDQRPLVPDTWSQCKVYVRKHDGWWWVGVVPYVDTVYAMRQFSGLPLDGWWIWEQFDSHSEALAYATQDPARVLRTAFHNQIDTDRQTYE